MRETTKASYRRAYGEFWESVFRGEGLDIGSGDDPLDKMYNRHIKSVRPFDIEDGDAQVLSRYVQPCSYDFVHSSNCLEHMRDPFGAILEWYAAVKPGGHLVITVPDEDLYEQGVWPSQWNQDHKWTFTLWKEGSWSKKSINVTEMVSILHNAQVRRIELCDNGYDYSLKGVDQTYEGNAESFIEVVIRKMPSQERQEATYKHSGARGDLVYGLPCLRALGGGKLLIGIDSTRYLGKPMDEESVRQFRELLETQEYIDSVEVWDGSEVTYDLDDFRQVNVDAGLISMGHLVRFGVAAHLSHPWLSVVPNHVKDIVVNRTWRYHGPFAWDELRPWQDKCGFVGSDEEYREFTETTMLEMEKLDTRSYTELAEVVAGANLFVGNQSFPYALAEAMKTPRVLEVCTSCPNCEPQGADGYTRLTQDVILHYVAGTRLSGEYDCRSHLPWMFIPSKGDVEVSNRLVKPTVSCIIPFQEDHAKAMERFAERAKRSGVEVIIEGGDGWFSEKANRAADRSSGDVICVVDISRCDDYGVAEFLARQFTTPRMGMVGMCMATDAYPHPSGPCFAVSRRAYQECGLFNLSMQPGKLNLLEMSLRYARRKYASKSGGLGRWGSRQEGDEQNVQYIEKVYGVKV